MVIDKKLIAESFSRAAGSYDAAAFLQQEVAQRTLERLPLMRLSPSAVLDIGCGTGYCTRHLKKYYRKSRVTGVDIAPGMVEEAKKQSSWLRRTQYQVADADQLPFADEAFDLVFSSLTLQWLPDLEKTFSELNRVLKPGGLLLFSTLGPDTLTELRQSWAAVDSGKHVNDFLDMHIVGDQVQKARFENVVMEQDVITLTYQTLIGLMRDLKAIGAHNLDSQRNRGMLGKQKFAALKQSYDAFRSNEGLLPATYEVVYGHAWKSAEQPKADYHTYEVSIASPDGPKS